MPALAVLVILGLLVLFAWPSLEAALRRMLKRDRKHRYFRD